MSAIHSRDTMPEIVVRKSVKEGQRITMSIIPMKSTLTCVNEKVYNMR